MYGVVVEEEQSWATGVNFINVLLAAFALADPRSVKRLTTWLSFCAFSICSRKSWSKNIDEIVPRWRKRKRTHKGLISSTYMCGFFLKTGWEAFLALKLDKRQTEFGRMCANLRLNFVVLNFGKIEQWISGRQLFADKKFCEIDPRRVYIFVFHHSLHYGKKQNIF